MIFETYIQDYIKANNIEGYTLEHFSENVSNGSILNIEENEVVFLENIQTSNPITFFTNDQKFTSISSLAVTAICTGFIQVLSLTGTATLRGAKLLITSYKTHSLVAIADEKGNIENLAIKEN